MAKNLVSMELSEDKKCAVFTGNTYSYKDMIKCITGSKWDKRTKSWMVPIENLEDAKRILPNIIITPELLQAYSTMKSRLNKAVSIKEIDEAKAPKIIKGLKAKLYGYQAVGVEFLKTLANKEGSILAFDMGLGKSLTGLGYFTDLLNKAEGIEYCLVVCPAPLKYSTWAKEIEKWTDLEYQVIDGDRREKVEYEDGTTETFTGKKLREVQYQQYLFGSKILVVNYELFLRDTEIMPTIDDKWLVILDECHKIKNIQAITTKNIVKHLQNAGRKVLASGTPLENNIQEIWQLVDFCRTGMLGSYYKFVERFLEKDFFGKPIAPKPQMMPELKEKLAPIMLRKTKEEALPDLPPLTIQEYWVDMTPEQRRLYKNVKDGILENINTGEFSYLEVLAQITRLQQVCDSPALLRKVIGDDSLPQESGKLNELTGIIEDIHPDRKFLVFSQYKEMADIIYQHLISSGTLPKEKIGYIHGGMKSENTAHIQRNFQEGNIRCIVLTTAGNYGLDLSAGNYVICYDCLFNPQKMNQIYSRCHRNGVKNAVTAINIVTRGSYEEKKLTILEKKKELFTAMVDADDAAFAKLFTKQELIDLL